MLPVLPVELATHPPPPEVKDAVAIVPQEISPDALAWSACPPVHAPPRFPIVRAEVVRPADVRTEPMPIEFVKYPFPFTESVCPGEVVPMPTLPADVTLNLSRLFVSSRTSFAVRVPRSSELAVLSMPTYPYKLPAPVEVANDI